MSKSEDMRRLIDLANNNKIISESHNHEDASPFKSFSSWGNISESEALAGDDQVNEDLHKWFKEKWVRFGPDGKIRGDCARGDDSEGKPKCLPQSKAHSVGKKARASAASRKRRKDPNADRSGKAINVNTKKKKSNEGLNLDEKWSEKYKHSIDCSHPKGFSQKAHCAGKKKNESIKMEMVCPDCGMCETHIEHKNLEEACWKGYHKEGNKELFGKTVPNCVKNTNEDQGVAEGSENLSYIGNCTDDDVIEHIFGDATNFAQAVEEHGDEFTIDDLVVKYDPESDVHSFYYKKQGVAEGHHAETCPHCGGEMVSEELINEKKKNKKNKDACYRKVKSRYKVWPSAYASGALVQCRKKGAANWGNKSESVEEQYHRHMNSDDDNNCN